MTPVLLQAQPEAGTLSRTVRSTWEADAYQRATALKDLPDDWDRGRSRKPTVAGINSALAYIDHVARVGYDALPAPFIAPMSDGGVIDDLAAGDRRLRRIAADDEPLARDNSDIRLQPELYKVF